MGKYPFVIANTDSSEKGGTHWWSILDYKPKTDIFCFGSFGLDGFKNFIIQDDQEVIEKIFGTGKMTKTDDNCLFLIYGLTLMLVKIYLKMSLMP